MHLIHTNERASTFPFEGDPFALAYPGGRSTATFYHRHSKTFYYYYRPDYPAYPPQRTALLPLASRGSHPDARCDLDAGRDPLGTASPDGA